MREASNLKNSKVQKGIGNVKNEKPLGPKNAAGTGLKKSKNGKDVQTTSAVSSSLSASDSRPKQPFPLRTKGASSNDRQIAGNNSKPAPALSKAHQSKVSVDNISFGSLRRLHNCILMCSSKIQLILALLF